MYFKPLLLGCGSPTQPQIWGHLLSGIPHLTTGEKLLTTSACFLAWSPRTPQCLPSSQPCVSAVLILGDADFFEKGFDF